MRYRNLAKDRQKLETRYQGFIEAQRELLICLDIEGILIFCNEAFYTKIEKKPDEVLGKKIQSIIYEKDRELFTQALNDLITSPNHLNMDLRLLAGDVPRWTSWELYITAAYTPHNDAGSVEEIIGWGRDITAYKLMEDLLLKSEERYRALLGHNPAIVYSTTLTPTFSTIYVSPRVEELLGYSQEQWLSDPEFWSKCRHPEDSARVATNLNEVITHGQNFIEEYRMITRDGRVVWVRDEAYIVRDEDGKPIRLQGFMLDITERIMVEETLKEMVDALGKSEARNLALLDVIPDHMYLIKKDGEIVDIHSGGMYAAYSPDRKEKEKTKPSTNLSDLFPADVAECFLRNVNNILETGALQVFEYVLNAESGIENFEARLVVSGRDEVLAIVRNISERVRLEQMKSDFVNRAAHELRTPLTTAIMMVDLIREGGSEEELQEYWNILEREMGRQRTLVEQLLSMGRIESGSIRIIPVLIDLKPIIHDVLSTIRHLAEKKRISLDITVAKDLPSIKGDRQALHQVFINLMDNAVKYTQFGGEVKFKVIPEREGVQITVEDSGIGIPSQDLPHIFERFFRASNAEQTEIQGSGVGLYIAKSFIEKMQGMIKVESILGKGTILSVWLPAWHS